MESQFKAALRYLSDNDCKGLLPLSDDVMEQLQEKHPEPQDARLGYLLFGPIEDIPDCRYHQIDRKMSETLPLEQKDQEVPWAWIQWHLRKFSAANHSSPPVLFYVILWAL